MLRAAVVAGTAGECAPKAIVVPHAGYMYSGSTAALAYAHLAASRSVIRRVVLLGPAHRVAVRGLALPGVDVFATPLGEIALDQQAIKAISHLPQVVVSAAAHAQEHSLEVQLPFLQAVLDDFKLVPLVVGDATPAEVAQVLETLWGGPETLLVISSDLSHCLPYRAAQAIALGTALGASRLIRTLGLGLCRARPIHGFSAQLASALVILSASLSGGPVPVRQNVDPKSAGMFWVKSLWRGY